MLNDPICFMSFKSVENACERASVGVDNIRLTKNFYVIHLSERLVQA
jgi:hypothetical protein